MIQNETRIAQLLKRPLHILFVLSFAIVLGSCSQKVTTSEGITIALQPMQSYLLPGSAPNCLDVSSYKKAVISNSTPIPTEGTSVTQLRVSFPKFSLSWSLNTTLYVAYLRLTIISPAITGGKFEYDVSGAELSALLGRSSNSFKGKTDLSNSEDVIGTGKIYSDDPARDCSGTSNVLTGVPCVPNTTIFTKFFGACGLDVGGVTLVNPTSASQFTAPFTLKLVGYSVDSGGNQTPVFTILTGTVIYGGIN